LVTEKTANETIIDNVFKDGIIMDREYLLNVLEGKITPPPGYIRTILDRAHERINK